MKKILIALVASSSLALGACATNSETAGNMAQGAAGGAVLGAAAGAVIPGVNVIEGAAIGAAVGGLAGAVWTDQNNDGYADGYTQNGTYYAGSPILGQRRNCERSRTKGNATLSA